MDREKKNQEAGAFEKWEVDMVKKRARTLVGKYGFTDSHLEDLEQDLFVAAYKKKVEADVSIEGKQFRRILDNKVSDIIKGVKTDKRFVQAKSTSLSKPIEPGQDKDPVSMTEILDEDKVRAVIGRIPHLKEEQIRADFWSAYELLSDRQKQIFLMLCDEIPKTEIARHLGISRETIYVELRQVYGIFQEKGLVGEKEN